MYTSPTLLSCTGFFGRHVIGKKNIAFYVSTPRVSMRNCHLCDVFYSVFYLLSSLSPLSYSLCVSCCITHPMVFCPRFLSPSEAHNVIATHREPFAARRRWGFVVRSPATQLVVQPTGTDHEQVVAHTHRAGRNIIKPSPKRGGG